MRVVNASPLIHLARVSLLDLLMPGLDVPVVVPFIVFQEVLRGARHDPSGGLVEQAARDWLTIVPVCPPHPGIDLGRIDAGEMLSSQSLWPTPGQRWSLMTWRPEGKPIDWGSPRSVLCGCSSMPNSLGSSRQF